MVVRALIATVAMITSVFTGLVRTPSGPTHLLLACPSGHVGFTASFWNPYDDWTLAQTTAELQAQRQVAEEGVIVDWAVDQEAGAAWYPSRLGYHYFENTLPTLLAAARSLNQQVWMGLIVSPNLFQVNGNSWSFLAQEVPRFEAVADELYRLYGASIAGWYIPTEPDQSNVSSYSLSYQYGAWLRQIDDYLHQHDGDKRVMIALQMPSAVNSGLTPLQFVQEAQPMMSVAHMDVWNVEDGFGMTGWTPAQEAAGFTLARQYASQDGASVWADVYTPSNAPPSQWEPYLAAIAATGVTQLTEWTFPDYMDPSSPAATTNEVSNFLSYSAYCLTR
jgi:hypothetical protein